MSAALFPPSSCPRLIVKIGSALLVDPEGGVRRGWLERWVDKHDRRQTMVRLTGEGRRVLTDIKKRNRKHVGRSLAGLTAAEREQLVGVTRALARVLGTPGDEGF